MVLIGMTTGRMDDRFGDPAAAAPSLESVQKLLEQAELYWLTTVRPDGRPHVTPLVGVWSDGHFAFCTGAGEQKHVNLQRSPLVAVTTSKSASSSRQIESRMACSSSTARTVGRVEYAKPFP